MQLWRVQTAFWRVCPHQHLWLKPSWANTPQLIEFAKRIMPCYRCGKTELPRTPTPPLPAGGSTRRTAHRYCVPGVWQRSGAGLRRSIPQRSGEGGDKT